MIHKHLENGDHLVLTPKGFRVALDTHFELTGLMRWHEQESGVECPEYFPCVVRFGYDSMSCYMWMTVTPYETYRNKLLAQLKELEID
jgi:hypothetical protein